MQVLHKMKLSPQTIILISNTVLNPEQVPLRTRDFVHIYCPDRSYLLPPPPPLYHAAYVAMYTLKFHFIYYFYFQLLKIGSKLIFDNYIRLLAGKLYKTFYLHRKSTSIFVSLHYQVIALSVQPGKLLNPSTALRGRPLQTIMESIISNAWRRVQAIKNQPTSQLNQSCCTEFTP